MCAVQCNVFLRMRSRDAKSSSRTDNKQEETKREKNVKAMWRKMNAQYGHIGHIRNVFHENERLLFGCISMSTWHKVYVNLLLLSHFIFQVQSWQRSIMAFVRHYV